MALLRGATAYPVRMMTLHNTTSIEDAQNLTNRFERHWSEWFPFLIHAEVNPDDNDAEQGLRLVVMHRNVSSGVYSHLGGQSMAMTFHFLETIRLQVRNPAEESFGVLASFWNSPPQMGSVAFSSGLLSTLFSIGSLLAATKSL